MKKQIIRVTQMLQKMSLKNLKKAGTKPEIAALVVKTGIRAGRWRRHSTIIRGERRSSENVGSSVVILLDLPFCFRIVGLLGIFLQPC